MPCSRISARRWARKSKRRGQRLADIREHGMVFRSHPRWIIFTLLVDPIHGFLDGTLVVRDIAFFLVSCLVLVLNFPLDLLQGIHKIFDLVHALSIALGNSLESIASRQQEALRIPVV